MAAKEQDPIKVFIVGGDTVEQSLVSEMIGTALLDTHGFKNVKVYDIASAPVELVNDEANICDMVDRLRPNLYTKPFEVRVESVLAEHSRFYKSTSDAVLYQPLRSKGAVWSETSEELDASLLFAPELLTNKALVNLVRQLDRRFMQLVEKVDFERANELVDYAKLKEIEK